MAENAPWSVTVAENNSGSGPQNATTGTIRTQTSETVRPTASTPKLNLDEIRARAEAAAPGPWECEPGGESWMTWIRRKWVNHPSFGRVVETGAWLHWGGSMPILQIRPTLEFVAHARTDVPALLDEVEKLRVALREADKALGETLRYDPGIERALGAIRAALGEP